MVVGVIARLTLVINEKCNVIVRVNKTQYRKERHT